MSAWRPEEKRPEQPEPVSRSVTPGGPLPSGRLLLLACLFYGAMAGLAAGWCLLTAGTLPLYASPAAAERGVDWLRDPAAGLLAGAIVVLLSRELTRRTQLGTRLARTLASALGPLRPREVWALALLSGLGEEAFFRGALQPALGLWIASLLFGLAHLVPRREWLPWSGFALGAGLLLGWLFEATGNLVAPVLTHVLVNGLNLGRLVREHSSAPGARL